MPGCQRLPIEDIQHRTANPAPFHGIYQRGLVHNRTSRSVDLAVGFITFASSFETKLRGAQRPAVEGCAERLRL
jgi:hypothetical protein